MAIHVIDAPMGTGKTSAMINYMREAPPEKHFVFVTPFLSESERIVEGCPEKEFVSPTQVGYIDDDGKPSNDYRSKLMDFKELLRVGRNIATTHALFQRFDPEACELIVSSDYTLVMDEVCDLIASYDITLYDAGTLSDKYITTTSDGHALWREDAASYKGRFLDYKYDCDLGVLWQYHRTSYMQVFLPELFAAFKECFLMTYMFDSQIQRCYFDLHGLEYDQVYVDGDSPETYAITNEPRVYAIPGVKEKVHILYDRKLNAIGEDYHALSRRWYEQTAREKDLKQMQDNAYNFFRNKMKAKSTDCLWTCYKEIHFLTDDGSRGAPMRICPRGYKKQYVSCNARATNSYKDRHYLAYLINLFPLPELKNFLNGRGIDFNRDEWALSMMVQWIWRSAIRDGEEIWVYVPSRRMRTLLEQWLEEVNA